MGKSRKTLYQYMNSFIRNSSDKKLIAIPAVVFVIAVLIIAGTYAMTGYPVKPGMDFVGGTQFTVTVNGSDPATSSDEAIRQLFADYPLSDIRSSGDRINLQFSFMDSDELMFVREIINSHFTDVEEKSVAPTYSADLQKKTLTAVLLSFVCMGIVVLIIFKQIVPAMLVLPTAISDIVIPIAFMNIFGIELSLGTIAALLMLIGYSVDSDILLQSKVLKRGGEVPDKISRSLQTGLTMTTTTICAFLVMYLVSTYMYLIPSFPQITLLSQISLIILIGLLADLMNTWLLHVGMLRKYTSTAYYRRTGRRSQN